MTEGNKPIMLNLGSGGANMAGYVNIDNRAECKPDICCDIIEGLPFADSSVDLVRAKDFLEHIPAGASVLKVINEIWRVLKDGGVFNSSTPDCEFGMAAFQDPFHVSFWCENSWDYYSRDDFRAMYGIKAKFRIESKVRFPSMETHSRMFWINVRAIAIKS